MTKSHRFPPLAAQEPLRARRIWTPPPITLRAVLDVARLFAVSAALIFAVSHGISLLVL